MTAGELQSRILEIQTAIVQLQAELEATDGGENVTEANLDEALVAYFDLGTKAVQWVKETLHKLG